MKMRLRDIVMTVLQEGTYSNIGFNVAGDADFIDSEQKVEMKIRIDRKLDGGDLSALHSEIYDAIVHEVTHLGQENIEAAEHNNCGLEYFACLAETEAFVSGFLARAELEKRDVSDVMDVYLNDQLGIGRLKPGEEVFVKKAWMEQVPRLNPKIEAEKRLHAGSGADQLMDIIVTEKPASGEIFMPEYTLGPDKDDDDYFLIDYDIMYPAN